jgi:ABC-2 type transport system permease protein
MSVESRSSGGSESRRRSASASGLRRELGLVAWQVRYEQRAFWRNRRRGIFSLGFPLMFLVVFGSLNHGGRISSRGNLSFIDFYIPGIMAYAALVIAFTGIAMSLSMLRYSGILKRMRPTPMPLTSYLAAIVLSTVLNVLAATAILLAIGCGLLGGHVRGATLPGLIVTLLLATICFTTLGIAVSRLIPNPDSGTPVLMFIVLPLSFISNVFFPLDGAPGWLDSVSKAFPLRPLADGLQAAFDPRTHSPGLVGHDLRTLLLWTVVGSLLMVRAMRALSARD